MNVLRANLTGLILLVATLGGVLLAQCDRGESAQRDDSAVVDSELLAFLSLARAHHHEANLLEQNGDTAGAIAALRKIIDTPKPHPGQTFPRSKKSSPTRTRASRSSSSETRTSRARSATAKRASRT